MYGFEQTGIEHHDIVPGRTLKSLLRTHLPELQPRIQARIEQAFAEELEAKELTDGTVYSQWQPCTDESSPIQAREVFGICVSRKSDWSNKQPSACW